MPPSAWSGSRTPDLELQTDGAVTAGQQFSRKLTATTELKAESRAALWKMDDFGDALYSVGDWHRRQHHRGDADEGRVPRRPKARTAGSDVEKNDIAALVSFVYKFD